MALRFPLMRGWWDKRAGLDAVAFATSTGNSLSRKDPQAALLGQLSRWALLAERVGSCL